ncbi:MAG: diguanylate cyclase [Paracoccaceae bacterium]
MAQKSPLIQLDGSALDVLLPMCVAVSPDGLIQRVSPSITKLYPEDELVGRPFLDVFDIVRPRRKINDYAALVEISGATLRLLFRGGKPIMMKGVLVENIGGGVLVNLSYGFHLVEAVAEYGLSNADFSPTDLAIEMLYLIESKTAVLSESRKLNQRLHGARVLAEEQASSDALTGLKNRRAMDVVLNNLAATSVPFGLMHVDLDYFKAVNDTLGHAAGDHVLKVAADILVEETRDCDTVARVGGDEFVLIFEDLVDAKRLMKIANRIVKHLEVPVEFEDKICRISGSIGFTTSDFYSHPDLDKMLSDADVALYASKHKGRACSTMVTKELLAAAAQARDQQGNPDAATIAQ